MIIIKKEFTVKKSSTKAFVWFIILALFFMIALMALVGFSIIIPVFFSLVVLTIVMHPILRALGRRGFIIKKEREGGSFKTQIIIDKNSFQKI